MEEYKCYDCSKEIKVVNKKIKEGFILTYDNDGEKIYIIKCKSCYDKNKSLSNFQKCEVYSRIVGYLRPVSQWNIAKKQEFKDRKEYKI